jgi:hypothetical protein
MSQCWTGYKLYLRMRTVAQCHEGQVAPVVLNRGIGSVLDTKPCLDLWSATHLVSILRLPSGPRISLPLRALCAWHLPRMMEVHDTHNGSEPRHLGPWSWLLVRPFECYRNVGVASAGMAMERACQVVGTRAGDGADLGFANADAESRMLRTVDNPRRFQPRAAPRDALQGLELRHGILSDPGSAPHDTRPQPAVHLSSILD